MTNLDTNKVVDPISDQAEKSKKAVLVELKNGKIVFKQRIISFEKMSETMQEIVQFRDMLEQRVERREPPLTSFPDEFKPLIAKLVHESDKTLQTLSKYVHHELLPAQDEDDEDACNAVNAALPIALVEGAILTVCRRNNYGLDGQLTSGRVPASWHIWRWEVNDEHLDWLPKAAKDKATQRSAERLQAREDVNVLFDSLPVAEREGILGIKSPVKVSTKDCSVNTKAVQDVIHVKSEDGDTKSPSKSGKRGENKPPEIQPGTEEMEAKKGTNKAKKVVDPEKAAKDKERQEKRNAKAEKEKKEQEARNKSRSLFANFFKPKVSTPTKGLASSLKDSASNVASSSMTDFERTFKPFTLRKGVELAPLPWERRKKAGSRAKEIIVIDGDDLGCKDVEMGDAEADINVGQMTCEERLRDSIRKLRRGAPVPTHFSRRTYLKSSHPISVRTAISQLNEAEISGDDGVVRSLLSRLRDRKVFPVKVLIFTEDARPGYFGTWTRNSAEVGQRTPFARDVVSLDYTYDSGEEWEEEKGDADDVVEDAEEEDGGEDRDSDMDSWLVDDDEVEDPGTPIEDRDSSPGPPPLNFPTAKRKTKDVDPEKSGKRRRVVVPLVPYVKGPCWDTAASTCDYEPFKHYRVQFFHDSPTPIDPFTFVSAPADDKPAGPSKNASCAPSGTTFAVPALPGRLGHSNGGHTPAAVTNTTPKRAALAPKTTFPDVHVPLLLSKITSLDTGNITGIVETVFQELRPHKVKKNAIEAKIKEVAEKLKDKDRKVWVVKPDFKKLSVS